MSDDPTKVEKLARLAFQADRLGEAGAAVQALVRVLAAAGVDVDSVVEQEAMLERGSSDDGLEQYDDDWLSRDLGGR
jgi:hypothetical protein